MDQRPVRRDRPQSAEGSLQRALYFAQGEMVNDDVVNLSPQAGPCLILLMQLSLPFDRPFTLAEARKRGITRATVRGWLERGEAHQVGHGLFAPRDAAEPDAIRITRAVADGQRATSFLGAAALHGLLTPPDAHPPLRHPVRLERIPSGQLWRSDRVLLASPAWTAVTLARHQLLPSALVPLDSALRIGVKREALQECVDLMSGWPGSSLLRQAMDCADALAESALESLARGSFIVAGLPAPVLQEDVVANRRRYRLDFVWPLARLILEVDGMVKYDDKRTMLDEKRRHNDLQAAGYTVLRCGFTNVYPNANVLVGQIRRILAS